MSKKKKKAETKIPTPDRVIAPSLSSEKSVFALSVLLAGLAILLYANTISHHYALDDQYVIYQNKYTTQGFAGIPKILTTFYWQGYWTINAGLYRPLSLITFAIEWQLFPNNPHIAHLVNVLLYALTVVLLFSLLRKLLTKYSIIVPFVCSLLFLAHPVHTEVVANIKSRDEILCFLFFIVSAILFLHSVEIKNKVKLFLAAVAYLFCLLSKEGGLAFLAVFPLLLFFFRKLTLKESVLKSLVFLLPAALFLAVHIYVISHAPTPKITYTYLDNSLVAAPDTASRVATAIYMAGDYLKLLVFPHPLSYDYSFNQIPAATFGNPQVLFTLLIFAALLFFAIKKFKERNIYSFSILLYIITMAMVSNILILIGATFAVRFLYVPSLAFCIVLAITGSKFFSQKTLAVMASVLFLIYSVKTFARNADWKDNFTLFKADVNAAPGSTRVHYNYATAYMDSIAMKADDRQTKKDLLADCINEFEKAVSIDPKNQEALHNLGIAYYRSGNYPASIQTWMNSIHYEPGNASSYSALGQAYFRNGEYDKAIEALNKTIEMGFIEEDNYKFLGGSYFHKRDFKTAIVMFNKALEKNPNQDDVLTNLASAYGSVGDFDDAIISFKKSIQINPSNAQTYYFLGLSYQDKGDAQNAKIYLDKAKEMSGHR